MLYLDEIRDILIRERLIKPKNFFGKVNLVFQNGKITYIKKEETILRDPKRRGGTKEDVVSDA